jgi:hypothetical protein
MKWLETNFIAAKYYITKAGSYGGGKLTSGGWL